MLACKHVRAHLSDAHDGQLGGWYGFYVRLHSRVCPPCKRTRRSMERTLLLLRAMREAEPDGGDDGASL